MLHRKLANEAIFSYTLSDWLIDDKILHFDQQAGSVLMGLNGIIQDSLILKATVLPTAKKRAYAVLNDHIFVIVRVRYIKVYIFKTRRN